MREGPAALLVVDARTIRRMEGHSTEIGRKAWLFAKLQPGRAKKRINATWPPHFSPSPVQGHKITCLKIPTKELPSPGLDRNHPHHVVSLFLSLASCACKVSSHCTASHRSRRPSVPRACRHSFASNSSIHATATSGVASASS